MALLLISCQKEETITIDRPVVNIEEDIEVSEWRFHLGDSIFLRDTEGLRSMALSGNHTLLNRELDGIGTANKSIPRGLADDPEGDGYAPQRVYKDYIVAMYHPSTYPDHFITYNWKTGAWIRWDLSDGPDIFRQSE